MASVEGEVLTIVKVPNGFEDLTVGKQWPQPGDPPRRLPTGEEVELRVEKDPRSYRITQSAM